MEDTPKLAEKKDGFVDSIVRSFLYSNLSLILVLLSAAVGLTALFVTPREEDPQIIVPMADIHVRFPGHSAFEVEQLVATPLEKLLYEIDGVEYVYSMSQDDYAMITARFYVGEDRERSLVKLYKRIDENVDIVPPGVTSWVIKPIEIDDVPVVTLTLTSETADSYSLRRTGEELVRRLSTVENLSRAYVVGGESRVIHVYLDAEALVAYNTSPIEVRQAIEASNVTQAVGGLNREDEVFRVEVGEAFDSIRRLDDLVIGVFNDQPVFLKDVARVIDGPSEVSSYVRHGWGPARGWESESHSPGTVLGSHATSGTKHDRLASTPAVTIAIAKKRGTNAVSVAEKVIEYARELKRDVVPDDMNLIITRNAGLTADHKVNELVEALGVAIVIVIALLTFGLGWRESLIVATAVPVVFGLTLTVNLLAGYTINRVTLFALILSLGLLVDDPIVDVENIARHFKLRGRASRPIVLEAVREIRPPLITATLAVIVSFLPMFFITGMMGPYMRPMALNVPVAMLMSMVVAFTITPWISYHVLKRKYGGVRAGELPVDDEDLDPEEIKQSPLYKFFYPLMAPLMHSRVKAYVFLGAMCLLTLGAMALAAVRAVPLKMLPFDNKNELLLVLDMPEGTTLERTDALVREYEAYLASIPEVTDYTSHVGLASPMDFNGMVRHYYLRQGDHLADIRINLVGKKSRKKQSHGLALRMRNDIAAIAKRHGATFELVETPPGPPVLASLVAEVYGEPSHAYEDIIEAAAVVRERMKVEPGVVEVDDGVEANQTKLVFVVDQEKAALNGISVSDIAQTISLALGGESAGTMRMPRERDPLHIELQLPEAKRSSARDLSNLYVKGQPGNLVPIVELGEWREKQVSKTIYHKNMKRVVYVYGETAGRAPANAVVDIQADFALHEPDSVQEHAAFMTTAGFVSANKPIPVEGRTFLSNGSRVPWSLDDRFTVDFAGEGEWKITLDVFRDLGLAFAAAMVGIYILLVAQTGSFIIPIVVMLAIPLTGLGIMPGFWLLNVLTGESINGFSNPVFFTATGMIGMIALSGIVTRDSIILVDFIHLSLRRGRSLFDAIMESRVVRLRPILLTTATAMLSAAPIAIDPIFSGLAWALIFGLFASTIFTLFVIPIAYWLLYENKPGHGLNDTARGDR